MNKKEIIRRIEELEKRPTNIPGSENHRIWFAERPERIITSPVYSFPAGNYFTIEELFRLIFEHLGVNPDKTEPSKSILKKVPK